MLVQYLARNIALIPLSQEHGTKVSITAETDLMFLFNSPFA